MLVILIFCSILLVPGRVSVLEVPFGDEESSNVCSSSELHKKAVIRSEQRFERRC